MAHWGKVPLGLKVWGNHSHFYDRNSRWLKHLRGPHKLKPLAAFLEQIPRSSNFRSFCLQGASYFSFVSRPPRFIGGPISVLTVFDFVLYNFVCFLGTKRDEELAPTHTELFHKIHEPFWEDLLAERETNLIAKNKLFSKCKLRYCKL